VIDQLTPENNGQFLSYEDGALIPWLLFFCGSCPVWH
jgi:hypothetical protein